MKQVCDMLNQQIFWGLLFRRGTTVKLESNILFKADGWNLKAGIVGKNLKKKWFNLNKLAEI